MAGIDPASFPIGPAGMTLPPDALLGLGVSEETPYPVTTNILHLRNSAEISVE